MLALLAAQEFCFRFIRCPCLDQPVKSLVMVAFWTGCISKRKRVCCVLLYNSYACCFFDDISDLRFFTARLFVAARADQQALGIFLLWYKQAFTFRTKHNITSWYYMNKPEQINKPYFDVSQERDAENCLPIQDFWRYALLKSI